MPVPPSLYIHIWTHVLGILGQRLHRPLGDLGQLLQQQLRGLLRLRGELRDDVLLQLPALLGA